MRVTTINSGFNSFDDFTLKVEVEVDAGWDCRGVVVITAKGANKAEAVSKAMTAVSGLNAKLDTARIELGKL